LRAITSKTGAGPYTVNFALPLERAHANGAAVTNGPGAPFLHKFALLNAGNFQTLPLSVTDYNGDATKGIPGCLVVSLGLKWNATGLLTADVKLTGFQSATQTKPTPAFSAERAFQGYLSTALFASEYSKLTGSTPTTLVLDWLTGAGAATREIKFQMSNTLYKTLKPTRGKSYMEMPIEFDGKGNTTDIGASGGWGPALVTVQNGRNKAY
jgi:hypothetical protein